MADIFLTAASLGVRMYKGDSFSQNFEANWDLSQTTITAELRKDGKKVDDFVITAPVESQETPGTYLFTATLEDTDISGYYKWYFVFEGDTVRTNINGEFIISDRDDTKQSKKTTEVGQTLTKLNLQEATETISIVAAQGEGPKGEDGDTPYIQDGTWWINGTDTGIQAVAADGVTPVIGQNGNWFVDGNDTGIQAEGQPGPAGDTPYIQDGTWWIDGTDTGIKAVAEDGITPVIGQNGNWFLGDTDTGVLAEGQPGQEGKSAYQVWLDAGNTGTEQDFLDSLQGTDGDPAPTPEFQNVEQGPTVATTALTIQNVTDTGFDVQFQKAVPGKNLLQWRPDEQTAWATLAEFPSDLSADNYIYQLYTGSLSAVSDVGQIEAETLADFGTDITQLQAEGTPGETINFNVLVADSDGNKAIYQSGTQQLLDPQVLGITVTPDPIEIDKDEVLTLGVTVNVQDGAGQGFTLSINDNSIASISGADITGLVAGSGIVTVTSDYDPSFSVDVSIVVSSDAPAVPTFLPAGFSNTIDSITVDWANVPEADTFEGVLEDSQGSPVQTFSGITATSRLFQGLDSGTAFKVKVRSSGPGGVSAYAEENVQTDDSELIETTDSGYFTP